MATINLTVGLDNGTSFTGTATMQDNDTLLEIARTLSELLRERAIIPPEDSE